VDSALRPEASIFVYAFDAQAIDFDISAGSSSGPRCITIRWLGFPGTSSVDALQSELFVFIRSAGGQCVTTSVLDNTGKPQGAVPCSATPRFVHA
jgi:hypothetical protein